MTIAQFRFILWLNLLLWCVILWPVFWLLGNDTGQWLALVGLTVSGVKVLNR